MKHSTALLAFAILLASCSNPGGQAQLKTLKDKRQKLDQQITQLEKKLGTVKPAVKTIPVGVVDLQPRSFTDYIEVQGRVDSKDNVNVNAEVPGVIKSVDVSVGDRVHSGQVLARLDDQVVRDQLAQMTNQLSFVKNIYDKQTNLWKQNIGTEVQLLQARNNYENVQKQIAVEQSQLDMYRLKSPIEGTVDEVDLKVGQSVAPGMNTIRVVNLQNLRVKAQIGEAYTDQVHQGDQVVVIIPDANDTLRATLSYVARVIDLNSRSFNVEIKLPSNKMFRPNMVAILLVASYHNPRAIVVPVNVIQSNESGSYVYLSVNQRAERVPVSQGRTYNGQTEITQGLKPGDLLINNGFQGVNWGDSLEIVP